MRRSRHGRSADVELTPLIDVLFILIIFFVLTASFVQGEVSVDLPSGRGSRIDGAPAVITLLADGSLLWKGRAVDEDVLFAEAEATFRRGEDILIAGDRNVTYGRVATLLDSLRGLGIESVSLALQGDGSR